MKSDIERAIEYFRMRGYFTAEELWHFWRKRDHDLNRNAFYRRVNRLKEDKYLNEIYRNVYTFSDKLNFEPQKEKILKKIVSTFEKEYSEINYCIWQTSWLHEFMIHQPVRQFTIFETEKDVVESVFFLLKSPKWQVFIKTDNTTIDYLFMEDKEVIVVKSMISRSPTIIQEQIKIPSLEKILIDVFCDSGLFSTYSGQELFNIYRYAQKKYHINYTRLLYYAKRRNKKNEVLEFVLQFASDSLKEILNDNK